MKIRDLGPIDQVKNILLSEGDQLVLGDRPYNFKRIIVFELENGGARALIEDKVLKEMADVVEVMAKSYDAVFGIESTPVVTAYYDPDMVRVPKEQIISKEVVGSIVNDDLILFKDSMSDGEVEKIAVCINCEDIHSIEDSGLTTVLSMKQEYSKHEETFSGLEDSDLSSNSIF